MTKHSETEYEAQDAARTLIRAEEIKATPKLFSRAKKEMVKQQKAVTRAIGKGSGKPAAKKRK